jgi:hypothetical protein
MVALMHGMLRQKPSRQIDQSQTTNEVREGLRRVTIFAYPP